MSETSPSLRVTSFSISIQASPSHFYSCIYLSVSSQKGFINDPYLFSQYSVHLFVFFHQSHKSSAVLLPLSFASFSLLWYINNIFLCLHPSCTSLCFFQKYVKVFLVYNSNLFIYYTCSYFFFISTSLFLTVFYSPVCNPPTFSLLALYCAPHALLSFAQGLNTTLGDKDPWTLTKGLITQREHRASCIQHFVLLFLSHTLHTFIHAYTYCMYPKTHTDNSLCTSCTSNLMTFTAVMSCTAACLVATCTQTCTDSTCVENLMLHVHQQNIYTFTQDITTD